MSLPDRAAVLAAPFAEIDLLPPAVAVERRPDGSLLLRSPVALAEPPRSVPDMLRRQARDAGERVFLAERAADGSWRRATYADVARGVRSLGTALLARGCSIERPVSILSGNGIDHAQLALAAMEAGVPVAPVSTAYSLMSQDFGKLLHVVRLLTPRLIFVDDGMAYAKALAALRAAGLLDGVEVVVGRNPPAGLAVTMLADLLATPPDSALDAAFAALTPDTIAKILFTSGSTGLPKGVINTHRMMCSNQQALAQVYRFLGNSRPPVLLDWLPWNHTFAGNHDFNMILFHGGTYVIDEGKPAPVLIERTIANLRDVAPTIYFNVPRGFDMVIPYLERDAALRDHFFSRLDLVLYAGAALPQHLWERLEALSVAATGRRVAMVSAWGSTETAPCATAVHWRIDNAGIIGLPIPGTDILLTPNASKLELRVRGPNVTPGYWRDPARTREAFDDDGFYRIGDAGRLRDDAAPAHGIVFDGRVAEDFKLTSGTWVHVGALRVAAIAAAAPLIQDCVVTGQDRHEIGLLVFPNPAGCATLCPDAPPGAALAELIARPELRRHLADGLAVHNRAQSGSSLRIARALLLATPPGIDSNEITDKGYINQRAVLEHRAAEVERLHAETPGPEVIIVAA
ncbi:feruloyl-CoA synthase [Vineibacter terrae]|uniref:Feruloyl-CoA synthase n=1 Tax=Vineibacter terrae TaxID=2586908 RepID=A0A5C8PSG3_9HYPH|nr:feruloyl-CoA synthase [Vineibacter terrae]TXL78837.1 feruloyl-CoA synthase [Vineibacter terrae]